MNQSGRFLIAAGTANYDYLPEDLQLPSVVSDIARIVLWFKSHGYQPVLPKLAQNPTSADLRREIGDWFSDKTRTPSDRVVIYYSGHGEVLDSDGHYLCARDVRYGELGLMPHTAYADEEI